MAERAEGCPCGLTGLNCTELDQGVNSFSSAMEENCFEEGFGRCFTYEGEAKCICKCGYSGDLCETRVEPLIGNFLGGFIFALLVVLLSVFALLYRQSNLRRKLVTTEFDVNKVDFVVPRFQSISPLQLFLFRFSMVIIFFPLYILNIVGFRIRFRLAPFTIWNWELFGILFMIGSFLSLKYLRDPSSFSGKAGWVEKFYLICLEIAFPTSIIIVVIVWAILLPGSKPIGQRNNVVNVFSFFMHGFNLLFLGIEYYVNRLRLSISHFPLIMFWTGAFGLFHIILMFVDYIVNDLPHCPIYAFLDMSSNFFMLFLVILIVFFVLVYLACAKLVTAYKIIPDSLPTEEIKAK